MDTVFPIGTLATMPFRESDDKIFGPGVLDMKGGIVISITAIKRLIEENALNKKIVVMITTDEEAGSETSRTWIEKEASKANLVLVLESGLVDGALKTWRKGVGDFSIKVKGKASHAGGAHSEGVNAIEELAHQVLKIQKLTDYENGTTLNVGVISGGTVSNVVPEFACAEIDFRVLIPSEADRITAELGALKPILPGTTIEISGGLNRPPMPSDQTMKNTFAKANAIASTIGQTLIAGGSGGGSDGNFVSPLGIPLLDGIGTYGEGLHSEREYIFSKSLVERAALVAALIYHW
jgi:glutamate carboxypeptidase